MNTSTHHLRGEALTITDSVITSFNATFQIQSRSVCKRMNQLLFTFPVRDLILEAAVVCLSCPWTTRASPLLSAACITIPTDYSTIASNFASIRAIAVATDISPPASPCGMCRQFIREFCDVSALMESQFHLVDWRDDV